MNIIDRAKKRMEGLKGSLIAWAAKTLLPVIIKNLPQDVLKQLPGISGKPHGLPIGIGVFALINAEESGQKPFYSVINSLADAGGTGVQLQALTTAGVEMNEWYKVHPYQRLDGNNVNIGAWNDGYFTRLLGILSLCKLRGLTCIVTLIDHCSFKYAQLWAAHPWNAANGGTFSSWQEVYGNPNHPVLANYLGKMLDTLKPFQENVIVELGNEMSCPDAFARWINDTCIAAGFKTMASGTNPGATYASPHGINTAGWIVANAICNSDGRAFPDKEEIKAIIVRCRMVGGGWIGDGALDKPEYWQRAMEAFKESK